MTNSTPTSVRLSQTIRAEPDQLFRAWTEPDALARWWRMDGPGWSFAGASIDLRVGGEYSLSMTDPTGKTHTARGHYRDVTPPTRLAFTWDWEDPMTRVGETLVTVEFTRVADGVTEVTLTHEGFAAAPRATSHEQGWMQLLTLLDRATSEEPA
jgi:uncharacterized protein YndB with AHSA1/START domain